MKINLKNKNTLSWGWSNSVYGILYTPAVLFALKILWLFHKRWNVSPVVRNIFQWSPFIVSALPFFSVVIIQWPVLKLVGTTWGGPLSTFFFAWVGAGALTAPPVLQAPCGVELWPPLSGPRGSKSLTFHSWPRSLGPYCSLSLAQTKLPTLGPLSALAWVLIVVLISLSHLQQQGRVSSLDLRFLLQIL